METPHTTVRLSYLMETPHTTVRLSYLMETPHTTVEISYLMDTPHTTVRLSYLMETPHTTVEISYLMETPHTTVGLSYLMDGQQRLRPSCAYAQPDQSLCWSLEYSRIVKLLTEHHLRFLSLKEGCTGSSESTFVKMPHCWKSHVMAQMFLPCRVPTFKSQEVVKHGGHKSISFLFIG